MSAMSPLTFGQQADAYLEWAHATQYHWMSPHLSSQMDVLSDNGHSIEPHRVAHGTVPAASHWVELAHAIAPVGHRPAIVQDAKLLEPFLQQTVIGLVDSGIGSAWLQANPMLKQRTAISPTSYMHWDMDTRSPRKAMPRVSHGAHVLSWLAGRPPYVGGGFANDVASRCPLILVNLPHDAVNDPTGRWLGRYVVDGLDYMIEQAAAIRAKRLVVNISWGPQTGPHDGSSLLERALTQRIDHAKQQHGLPVDMVLAAGNSRESRAHAQFDANTGCKDLGWVVPPAGKAPSFLELWWPPGTDISQVQVTVTAPGGHILQLVGQGVTANPRAHAVGVVVAHPGVHDNARPMALLALNPTGAPEQAAPHGRWRIEVAGVGGAVGVVHVYVARQSENLGGRPQGPDSWMDDPTHDQQRFRRHPGPVRNGHLVTREGTLSGLTSVQHAQVHVAAGATLYTKQATHYSSEGPAAGGAYLRPDWAFPTDETEHLHGVLGAGSRPGSVLRLTGTSMAAPQLARMLANGTPPSRTPPHDQRIGYGALSSGWASRHRP
jgi:hypothetical protein